MAKAFHSHSGTHWLYILVIPKTLGKTLAWDRVVNSLLGSRVSFNRITKRGKSE